MKTKFWKLKRFWAALAIAVSSAAGISPIAAPALTEVVCAVVECE